MVNYIRLRGGASQTGPARDDLEKYIEVDFTEITTKKAMGIRKSKEMNALLGDPATVHVGKPVFLQLSRVALFTLTQLAVERGYGPTSITSFRVIFGHLPRKLWGPS